MKREQYVRFIEYMRSHASLAKAIVAGNKILTLLGYGSYLLLLVLAAVFRRELLLRLIAVPGISFLCVSLYRNLRNCPRPYEAYGFTPIIERDKKGKSFPSRHTFSFFMIGMSWLLLCVPAGIVLLIFGIGMALVRVLGGVHYPKDVIAGALCGIMAALLGFFMIPW